MTCGSTASTLHAKTAAGKTFLFVLLSDCLCPSCDRPTTVHRSPSTDSS